MKKALDEHTEQALLGRLPAAVAFSGSLGRTGRLPEKTLHPLHTYSKQTQRVGTQSQSAAIFQVASRTRGAALFQLVHTLNRLSPYGRHTLSVRMQIENLLTNYLAFWQNKPL